MSHVGPEGRSYLSIDHADLARLAAIAHQDRELFFAGHPDWAALFAGAFLCTALCQGAAQHFLDGTTGINDLDIYTFYRASPQRRWCARRLKSYDFGDPKFGTSVDAPQFVGRRVDSLARAIPVEVGDDAVGTVQRYLRRGQTKTARLLAEKAVILLEPLCGIIIWPVEMANDSIPEMDPALAATAQ